MYPASFTWLMKHMSNIWTHGVKLADSLHGADDMVPNGHPLYYREEYEGLMWVSHFLTKQYRAAPELLTAVAFSATLIFFLMAYYRWVVASRYALYQTQRQAREAAAALEVQRQEREAEREPALAAHRA